MKAWIQVLFFRILNLESWIQNLDSRTFFFRIWNLESWIQKTLQSLQSFWDSRFKIILGDSMCVCVYVCVRECLHGYWSSIIYIYMLMLCIYIYMASPISQPNTYVESWIPKMSVFGGRGVPYIYIHILQVAQRFRPEKATNDAPWFSFILTQDGFSLNTPSDMFLCRKNVLNFPTAMWWNRGWDWCPVMFHITQLGIFHVQQIFWLVVSTPLKNINH